MRAPNILPAVIYTAYAVLVNVVSAVTAHVDRGSSTCRCSATSLGSRAAAVPRRRVAVPAASRLEGVQPRHRAPARRGGQRHHHRWRYVVVAPFAAPTPTPSAAALATLGGATSADAQVRRRRARCRRAGDEETWLHGKQRLRKAYVRAHPAFYHEFHAAFVASLAPRRRRRHASGDGRSPGALRRHARERGRGRRAGPRRRRHRR